MKRVTSVFYIIIHIVNIKAQNTAHQILNNPEEEFAPQPAQITLNALDWPGFYNNGANNRNVIGEWLLTGNTGKEYKLKNHEYEGYDGWYNNIAHPNLGAIDGALLRRSPAAYEDGSYAPAGSKRPNPLYLSDQLLAGEIGTKSKTGKSAFFVFFGQQIVEEILDAQRPACPPEYINIKVPKYHHYRLDKPNHTELPLLRTRYDQKTGFSPNNPRQQLNEITPFIDGGLFYGISKQWSDQLRTYSNGTIDQDGCLASSPDGLFPAFNTEKLPMANPPPPFYHSHYVKKHETDTVSRFFKLGNPRGNENSFLLSFGVLWFRWHNYLAKTIRRSQSKWSSDKVFNEARKWTIATYQQIVFYDWLPELLQEEVPMYTSYNPSVDPQIDQLFQSAAFRFGHTLVVPGVYLRDYIRNKCHTKFDTWGKNAIRTCNIFWRSYEPMLNATTAPDSGEVIDIDRILMGMSVQLSEREDHSIVEDLRGNVFGPLEFPRRDLMAINIQRGRDHGIPDFNTARESLGLPRVDFDHFKHLNKTVVDVFRQLHNNSLDDVDVWVGGILETTDRPGELFSRIILDQFIRIRDGDRFWFENKANKFFDDEEIKRIKAISVYDIVMAVTKMDPDDIPKNPFRVAQEMNDSKLIKYCSLQYSNCTWRNNHSKCFHLTQLDQKTLNETCSQGDSYDYFSNSEMSFILSVAAIGAFLIGTMGVVYLLFKLKDKQLKQLQNQEYYSIRQEINPSTDPMIIVSEWIGEGIPEKRIAVVLKETFLEVITPSGDILRAIDFSKYDSVQMYRLTDRPYLVIKCFHNYDLVLHFDSNYLRQNLLNVIQNFVKNIVPEEKISISHITWKMALKTIVTRRQRQELVEKFYRVVFAQAFKIEYSQQELLKVDSNVEKEIVNTELTISEFADSISMRHTDEFVKRMFFVCDKDKNGFITFRDFVDLLIIFANGTEEEKARLLFSMYDVNDVGYLTEENFITMIKSFLATVDGTIEESKIQETVQTMMKQADIGKNGHVEFKDFMKLFSNDIKYLSRARLNFKGVKSYRAMYVDKARDTLENIYESYNDVKERFKGEIETNPSTNVDTSYPIDKGQEDYINLTRREIRSRFAFIKYIELKSKEIFWYTLYTLVVLCIFAERAYYYGIEREHTGLRLIAGYGVMITRGAASAIMFTYSSLLVTMCRNTITFLRDTFVNKYFPFDSMVDFHKYIAFWAFISTLIHVIGHAFNFYHIATQPSDDLTCFFRNFFHSTHEIPKFHYWCWETLTGVTGVVLTLLWFVIYIFAQNFVRRKIYNWFWFTHSLYPLIYIFILLHGMARLIQPPFFHYFLLGPVILFTLDKMVSLSRKQIEIPVVRAEILPSNVTMLEFCKPDNFQYKSGQWVRIACLGVSQNEYHPFTLTSSPDEQNLTVHIRAVGPWTAQIRQLYDNTIRERAQFSRIFLDGPYGEGHQDWNKYEVSILIGGGIGVTPFSSILKDVISKSRSNQTICKKVYFIWVSRTQKQFEWLVDIIRDLEYKDTRNIISCHIFITQFFEKFDLRTVFLYICERHYQRISNRSLFTNLKAVTHFGRPSFMKFFNNVASLHRNAKSIGIFSCGPPSMTRDVERVCNIINRKRDLKFEHNYTNF